MSIYRYVKLSHLGAAREWGRSHCLVIGGEDDSSTAILLVRLVLTVNPTVAPEFHVTECDEYIGEPDWAILTHIVGEII